MEGERKKGKMLKEKRRRWREKDVPRKGFNDERKKGTGAKYTQNNDQKKMQIGEEINM